MPVEGGATLREILRAFDEQSIELAEFALRRASLDEVFLALTGHRADGGDADPRGEGSAAADPDGEADAATATAARGTEQELPMTTATVAACPARPPPCRAGPAP